MDRIRLILYYGARTGDELLRLDVFEKLDMEIRPVTEDGSKGETGVVTGIIEQDMHKLSPALYCGCGPEPMLKALARLPFAKTDMVQVSLEARMACGIGGVPGLRGGDPHRLRPCLPGRPGVFPGGVAVVETVRSGLEVNLGGLALKNPVMTASGTFGYGREFNSFMDLNRLGAIVVKGISLEPMPGNPAPRTAETPCGMINAIGLENVGLQRFINEKLPYLRTFDTPVVVNILGNEPDDYRRLAHALSSAVGVSALELNISCPNVKKGGIAFGTDPHAAAEVGKGCPERDGPCHDRQAQSSGHRYNGDGAGGGRCRRRRHQRGKHFPGHGRGYQNKTPQAGQQGGGGCPARPSDP